MAQKFRIARAAELQALGVFRDFVGEVCRSAGIDEDTAYQIMLAVDEAATNVITHGYAGMNPGSILLELEIQSGAMVTTLTDFGQSFEPAEPPAPDVTAALEDGPIEGFGLFLIYKTMDDVDYQVTEEGNRLILTKRISP
jgi:anti-sigma regulatory factor (Ser/Thr protein kinase)